MHELEDRRTLHYRRVGRGASASSSCCQQFSVCVQSLQAQTMASRDTRHRSPARSALHDALLAVLASILHLWYAGGGLLSGRLLIRCLHARALHALGPGGGEAGRALQVSALCTRFPRRAKDDIHMTVWLDPQPINVPVDLLEAVGGHPLVSEVLVRRGVATPADARAFLDPACYLPSPAEDLPDMVAAAERLNGAIRDGERITVWGDFDADGQTSAALLVERLRALGGNTDYYIPTRQQGHGLHQEAIERLAASGTTLILTCDTGITAHREIAAACSLGVDVIITDHHVPGDRLPPASAVVNTHRLEPGHPLGNLPGVGVAFQLARVLDPERAVHSLDLVALGTVADVATLTADTRQLVQLGLEHLRSPRRLGLRTLCHQANLQPQGITEEHISFVLAPRLNALGRLANAKHGVELLLTEDPLRAQALAAEMDGLNARRQWLTKQVTDAAIAQIERDPSLLTHHEALVLSQPTWPAGIVGIVAARLAERIGKPSVLISTPPNQPAAGSGRSVPGVNLIQALAECSHLFFTYGGHRAAAGFTMDPQRIAELRSALSRSVARQSAVLSEPVLRLDAYLTLPDLTLELVTELGRLAPFGPGNPTPMLAIRDLRILSETTIGRTGEHRRVVVEDISGHTETVFWWQGSAWQLPEGRFDLVVTLRATDFQGQPQKQVEWLSARLCQPEASAGTPVHITSVHDLRSELEPLKALQNLPIDSSTQIWAEVLTPEGLRSHTRYELVPSSRLIVWTLPPGPQETQAVLARVRPLEVLLVLRDPGLNQPQAFLTRLAGLASHVLKARQGLVSLEELAAATAHRTGTVRAGLDWLAARGQISIIQLAAGSVRIGPGTGRVLQEHLDQAAERLHALLEETAAYRHFASTAPARVFVDVLDASAGQDL